MVIILLPTPAQATAPSLPGRLFFSHPASDNKLLTEMEEEDEELQKLKKETETLSLQARNGLKVLDKTEKKPLLKEYESTEIKTE